MAAWSAEAVFSSSKPSLPCFGSTLLKSDTSKYWNEAQIMATASTESFWDDDPEEKIKKKILALKTKFHTGRQLQIKHLPRDVTEFEIRELLCDFPVQSVHVMNSDTGSSMARAAIEDPEMLEDWDKDRVFLLRGQRVPVAPTQTEMMLCIARLPFTYTEDQFTALVRSYGEICYNFLMISEKTGESKGYGFVEYTTSECALQAKNLLDKKEIEGWTLVCDWVDSCHVTFESLHSKCLYVDCLPKDFRDMSEFRKIFSTVVNPPYSQIALKNGCPQDWGLVEYSNWEDAEAAQTSLNGYCLRGQKICISYYIPGVHAINLYLKLLNDPGPQVTSTGLLPNPSGHVIVQSLQNLFKQNPIFAQNLQNIILGQIHASHSDSEPATDAQISPGLGTSNGPGVSKNGPGGKMFQTSSIPDGRKQISQATATAGQSSNKNGLHTSHAPPTLGPSPTQYLNLVPPPKISLLPNLEVAPPPARRLSLNPLTGETTTVALEEGKLSAYWAGVLGRVHSGPPPAGIYSNFAALSPAIHPKPPEHPFNIPPPNYIAENTSNMPVEIQQNIKNLLSNPQNIQQILTNVHCLDQPTSATLSPIPASSFSYPLNPMAPAIDPSWAIASSAPHPHHLPHSLLTSPIPVPVAPKPVNYLEVKPPPSATLFPATWATTFFPLPPAPQPLFSPFSAPGLIWPQPSTPIIASPQPNPLMTPIGQKRRLLPSPEPSPEGNFIGQHSQGIGGHYVDSYFKRKKKN